MTGRARPCTRLGPHAMLVLREYAGPRYCLAPLICLWKAGLVVASQAVAGKGDR